MKQSHASMVVAVGLSVLVALATAAGAAGVGSMAQSGQFTLELKAEHQTRDVNLKDPVAAYFPAFSIEDLYVPIRAVPAAATEYTTAATAVVSLWYDSFDAEETVDRYYVKGTLTLSDSIDLFGKVGVGRLKFKFFDPMRVAMMDVYDTEDNYLGFVAVDWLDHPLNGKGDWGMLYGGGLNVMLSSSPGFRLDLAGQYLYQEADADVVLMEYSFMFQDVEDEEAVGMAIKERITHTETTEWQVALVASSTMGAFRPYGGVKASQYGTTYDGEYRAVMEVISNGNDDTEEVQLASYQLETEPQDFIGFFAGATYAFSDDAGMNVEVRVGDETATTIGFYRAF